jgi:hypothetical protein
MNTSGMTIPFAQETTEFCTTLLQSHQDDNYLQITANVPSIYPVVHAAENDIRVSICFLFVDGTGNRD